jgi:hypothetical protein
MIHSGALGIAIFDDQPPVLTGLEALLHCE